MLAYAIVRVSVDGGSGLRIAMLVLSSVWLAIAVADRLTGGRVVAWMYSDDSDAPVPPARIHDDT